MSLYSPPTEPIPLRMYLLLARLGLANEVGESTTGSDELLRVLDLRLLLLEKLDLHGERRRRPHDSRFQYDGTYILLKCIYFVQGLSRKSFVR